MEPRKVGGIVRGEVVRVRVTAGEKGLMEERARGAGESVSGYVRRVVLGGESRRPVGRDGEMAEEEVNPFEEGE